MEKIPTQIIREGLVKLIVPEFSEYLRENGVYEPTWAPVFYNPQMKLNRDLSVAVVEAYSEAKKPILVADILAGTGVRGIRFAVEADNIDKVYINDKNPIAYEFMVKNIELNNVENIVEAENLDANLMLRYHKFAGEVFDYIDVDPFGSPVEFIDSALASVKIGGMLGITATDTAVLEGKHVNACVRKYFSRPIKSHFSKELAIRILLASIVQRAASQELGVSVKLSYYDKYYVRAYVVLVKGAKKADESLKKLGYVVFNKRSGEYFVVNNLSELLSISADKHYIVAGPIWCGNICEKEFLSKVSKVIMRKEHLKYKELIRLLQMLNAELNMPPLYYSIDMLGKFLKKSIPPLTSLIECLISNGYSAVRVHCDPKGFKTDAPLEVIYACFKKLSP
ncbi:MAG: tRNA (guanine(10)-N(2))-dimethyltransferase [Desulfurococcales archaeon ex4484_217_1]|nr:MAG: tRNA (guanine(10)-N(2))-dimethyltransferase [Desulfurococcales archaeon ex4484_217_1]